MLLSSDLLTEVTSVDMKPCGLGQTCQCICRRNIGPL